MLEDNQKKKNDITIVIGEARHAFDFHDQLKEMIYLSAPSNEIYMLAVYLALVLNLCYFKSSHSPFRVDQFWHRLEILF